MRGICTAILVVVGFAVGLVAGSFVGSLISHYMVGVYQAQHPGEYVCGLFALPYMLYGAGCGGCLGGFFGWLLAQVPFWLEKKLFTQGREALSTGDYDAALCYFTRAIWVNSRNAEAYCERGQAYARKGAHDRAIADFTKALRLKRDFALAFYHRSRSHHKAGDIENAIADATEAVQLELRHPLYRNALAAAYAESGDFDKAIRFQQKALEIATADVDKEECRRCLDLYRNGKRYEEAFVNKQAEP
jgi:tetratricopeptide (TPR) repeat protein